LSLMQQSSNQRGILVISKDPGLAKLARQAMGTTVRVDYVAAESEAEKLIEERRPDIIILEEPDSLEGIVQYYRRLREGWISRHSSIIIFQANAGEKTFRILDETNLEIGIAGYTYAPGQPAPFLPLDRLLPELREIIQKKLDARVNKLKAAILDPGCFCLTWEQIPGLGAFETRQEIVLENARKAARDGKVCAMSIVDNPGGNPAIATEILCSEIRKLGIEPMVHLAFRDKSRNQVESLLYQLAALDINNLLILTGDYPSNTGFAGTSRPVFDLDSVQGLQLISEMNRGMEHVIMKRKTRLAPTSFFTGVAVSPFKQQEAEVMGQYYKLKKKIAAGADFAITQIGYDARKWHELIQWLKVNNYNLPVLSSIQVLSLTTARAMHANRVPGAVVTDKLLAQIEEESRSPDKGKQARLDRAARMYAISRGLGFKGTCISGQGLSYESLEYIIDKGQEWSARWPDFLQEFDYPQEKGFYYFEKGPGISDRGKNWPQDPGFLLNSDRPAPRIQKAVRPPVYLLSRMVHASIFEPGSPLFKPVRGLMKFISSSRTLSKMFHSTEYWTKAVLYACKDCGDCALYDVAFLCPVSQCPKDQRNAPCGGSFEGWCEVYPGEKQCIWVRAYLRLKSHHKEDTIGDVLVPPCNWELWQTSSWLNYFTGKDHVSKRAGIQPPASVKDRMSDSNG
jgi:methylenetetrahydrofolate reductase (NADPH)